MDQSNTLHYTYRLATYCGDPTAHPDAEPLSHYHDAFVEVTDTVDVDAAREFIRQVKPLQAWFESETFDADRLTNTGKFYDKNPDVRQDNRLPHATLGP